MKTMRKFTFRIFLLSAVFCFFTSCEVEDGADGIDGEQGEQGPQGPEGPQGEAGEDGEDFTPEPTMFANKSALEPLVLINPSFGQVKAYSLLSTTDDIDGFHLAGSADGAGLLQDPDSDGYIYVVNNEDHYAVSRVFLDKNLIPYKGDYLLNSGVADYARQCSGTMWEAAIHGGSKDMFLSASESIHYDVKGIDPYVTTPTPTADFGLDALGEFSWENAVPLPQGAFSGKTVIIGGDDDSSGSEGQVSMYLSENGDADLEGGKILVLRFKEISDGAGGTMPVGDDMTYNEGDLDFQTEYEVEFVEIPNGASLTNSEMENACLNVNASQFMRVEDVDYGKGSDAAGRNIYFNVTGRGPGAGTYNDWGTVYKLVLDENDPTQGKLTQIISGNTDTNNMDGNLSVLQSPDNICVTENFVYFQEDPNSFSRGHNSYIYQSDLEGNNISVVLRLIVDQTLAEDPGTQFSGEFGSLIDVSDKVGVDGTFLLALQPHYWQDPFFQGIDGHYNSDHEDNQGSQIVLLQGLPR
ncbi:hypothetical protein RM553_15735 [Zunongwangia sp. F363]|uniref:Uncharacterized protein n=1 Tax=Autumnicola tepida TaxID=3075595 RepID=A0ABU3CD76_9FLAO|nr:hypothetical protein [Zunongwangia sp. F363]MDT0644289.1 hypothetical protein [Zunongwangia sp. F363]